MREVSKTEFFAAVGGPRDIHPDHHSPKVTIWRDQKTRAEVGRTRGWRNDAREPERYYLTQ